MHSPLETFDAVVIGGGPAGATAAADLAARGHPFCCWIALDGSNPAAAPFRRA